MPVDIRSFFSKKAPKKKKKKTDDNDGEEKKAKAKSSASSSSAAAATSSTNDDKKSSASSTARRKVVPHESSPKKKQEKSAKKEKEKPQDTTTSSGSKRKQGNSSSTTSSSSSAKSKAKKEEARSSKKEISVSDFFAKPAPSKKKPIITLDDTDEDDEEQSSSSPPPPRKKTKPSPVQQPNKHEEIDLSKDDSTDDSKQEEDSKTKVAVKKEETPRSKRKREIDDSTKKDEDSDDDDDYDFKEDQDDDEDEEWPPASVTSSSSRKSSPRHKTKTTTTTSKKPSKVASSSTSSASKKKPKKSPEKTTPQRPTLVPSLEVTSIDVDRIADATPECLAHKTFVFSGILSDSLSRDDAQDLVKTLGGRVTGAVSGKTDYLVVGEILEDGRPYTEGSKYKKAMSINDTNAATPTSKKGSSKHMVHIVLGEQALYGLLKQYSEATCTGGTSATVKKEPVPTINNVKKEPKAVAAAAKTEKAPSPAATVKNPYASAPKITNPYTKVKNPYAKASTTTTNPYAKKSASPSGNNDMDDRKPAAAAIKKNDQPGGLWVDKYKPTNTKEIMGNQDAVRKLANWLARWEDKFNHPSAAGKTFSNPNGGPWKAALLSGPPGIGKTTTATLVATEAGRDVIEFNASDVRSKKAMQEEMGDITGSQTIQFQTTAGRKKATEPKKRRCIIMDEVDGMGGGDRSGVSELIQMIKKTKVPIICICNDRQNQKLKSLIPYCMDLRYRRPVKTMIARRAEEVAAQEGWSIERNAAEAIAESCGNDVRQVLNCLQMWAADNSKKSEHRMSYKNLKDREKSINKDEVLRISLFDAARILLEGRKGLAGCAADPATERDHFMRRNDAFFVDYNFTGLLVQQNYIKVVQGQFNEAKRSNDSDKTVEVLERLSDAAASMSDFSMAEHKLRADQNWSVLPFVGALVVKTGYHAGGENGGFVPGFPEFTTWLGRNSTKGKKSRLLHELRHHMNYHISCGTDEMRMSYVPVLRNRFLSLVSTSDQNNITQAISLMDDYGLDRDDIFEKFDEFNMNPKDKGFSQIDSKKKAAFTRTYNAGSHTSQVLVAEQGGAKKTKRKASSLSLGETVDPDAIDDDKQQEPDDEDEEDSDGAKAAAAFLKKGRKKKAAAKPKGKGKATKAKPKTKGKKK